jgi:hypothetical protein
MPRHATVVTTADNGTSDVSSDEWNKALIPIISTANVTTTTSALPLTITAGASAQVLNVEKIEVSCAAGNGAQLASVAAGVAGQTIDIVVVGVNAGTTTTFTLTGTFSGGATSIQFPAVGTGLVGRGIRLIWSVTDSAWTVDCFYNEWPSRGIEVNESVLVDPQPIAGTLQLYAKNIGGRMMLKHLGPSGVDTPLQPFLGMNRCAMVQAISGIATLQYFGMPALTAVGTLTLATSAITNRYAGMQKADVLVGTAATNALASLRGAQALYFLGNAAGMGGFFFVMRGGPATGCTNTASNFFMGIGPTTAPTAAEPSTVSQMIGIGYDGADTQLTFMCKNSGTVVKTALNTTNFPVASFPLSANKAVPTTDRTDMYELVLFAAPNSPIINWRATDLITGAQWSGSVTAGTNAGPAVNTALYPLIKSSSMATSSIIGVTLASLYIETDF